MNTIYRIVWNTSAGKWVVASELAKGRKKNSSLKTAMLSLAVIGAMAGMGVPSVYAADISMPSCVAGEDPHETGCVPTSNEQLMTPFFADGGGDDGGRADNVAIGSGAVTSSHNSVAIGYNATANGLANVAIGHGANTTGSNAISMGYNATANGNFSLSLGGGSTASASRATAVGTDTVASGSSSTAIGNASKAATLNSVAFGNGAQAGLDAGGVPTGQNQTALGTSAKAVASGATAIGSGAQVAMGADNAVAIGSGSLADRANTVSVGTTIAGGQRQVVNVAAGTADTDTVNVSQLKGTLSMIGGGAAVGSDGSIVPPSLTVGGNTYNNVAAALGDVDGRVIKNTGDITAIDGRVTKNEGDIVNLQKDVGAATRYFKANGLNDGSDDASATGDKAVAIGANAKGVGNNSVALGAGAQSRFDNSIAIGTGSATGYASAVAIGAQSSAAQESVAMGNGAKANNRNDVAIGSAASATVNSTAVGQGTMALSGSVAMGQGATATGASSVALGSGSSATRANTVSVGTTAAGGQRQIVNVAAGTAGTDAVNLSQLTAIGDRVTKNEGDITAIDGRVTKNEGDILDLQNNVGAATRYFKADGLNDGSDDAVASGSRAVSMGAGSAATSAQGIAIGLGAKANTNEGTIAIGANSRATGENSVALGSSSIADRDNVVSVGMGPSIGNGTRQIINVTNGTENTDAVNVQQLKPAIAALGGGATFNANGTITGPQYTVTDLANGGSKTVNNVGDALGQLNANTTNLDDRVTQNEGDIIDLGDRINNGSVGLVQQASASAAVTVAAASSGTVVDFTGTDGTRQLKGVSQGTDGTDAVNVTQLRDEIGKASAGDTRYFKADGAMDGSDDAVNTGSRSVAMGAGSQAIADNAVALGADSVADRANAVSVGSKGNERQITNVAEGTEDTDAVNVGQLKKAGLVGGDGSTLDAVVYDPGSNRGSVTFGGVGGTKLSNVMAGIVSATSTDAVNGGQLWILQDQMVKLGDRVTNVENNGAPVGPVTPLPTPSPDGGRDPAFAATGDGGPASATGKDSVAVGTGASATADNSVAIGAGSVADRADTVSVGSAGAERQISNVSAGTQRTDAANWGQVQDALATANRYTDDRFDGVNRRIGEVQRQANRGIAASAALINVTPYMPGKTVLNAGVANYRGESALGVGVSRWNDSGRVNFNAGMSAAAGDSPIFRMGVGVVLGD